MTMRASACLLAASLATAAPARAQTPAVPTEAAEPAAPDGGSALGDDARARDLPRLERVRRVTLGVDLGMQALPARAGSADYAAGLAWAASARVELAPWMGLRFVARQSSHAVTLTRPRMVATDGRSAPGDTELRQDPLEAWALAARLEPTWVMTPRLRLWAGVGAGWLRVEAPAAEGTLGGGCAPREIAGTTTSCEIVTSARSGLGTELGATLGSSVDLVPQWLTLSLSTSLAAVVDQSGTLFGPPPGHAGESPQAFADGSLYFPGYYPRFGSSATLLLGLGLVL